MPNWLDVNPRSSVPISVQLVQQIKHALEIGILQTGDQLPTVRQLASELTIAPNTIVEAYDELANLGLTACWLDSNAYRPEKVAQMLSQPMLYLQGESDDQVTREDFQIWQDALGGRSDVQCILHPALSHLIMPVEGGQKATPATYSVAGYAAEEVVNEIGSWIKQSIEQQGVDAG